MEMEELVRVLKQKSTKKLEMELKTIEDEKHKQSLIKKIVTHYEKISEKQSFKQKEIIQDNCNHYYGDGFLQTLFIGDYTGNCLKCGKLQDPCGS